MKTPICKLTAGRYNHTGLFGYSDRNNTKVDPTNCSRCKTKSKCPNQRLCSNCRTPFDLFYLWYTKRFSYFLNFLIISCILPVSSSYLLPAVVFYPKEPGQRNQRQGKRVLHARPRVHQGHDSHNLTLLTFPVSPLTLLSCDLWLKSLLLILSW